MFGNFLIDTWGLGRVACVYKVRTNKKIKKLKNKNEEKEKEGSIVPIYSLVRGGIKQHCNNMAVMDVSLKGHYIRFL